MGNDGSTIEQTIGKFNENNVPIVILFQVIEKQYFIVSHKWNQGFVVEGPFEHKEKETAWKTLTSPLYSSAMFESFGRQSWKPCNNERGRRAEEIKKKVREKLEDSWLSSFSGTMNREDNN